MKKELTALQERTIGKFIESARRMTGDEVDECIFKILSFKYHNCHLIARVTEKGTVLRYNHGYNYAELIGMLEYSKLNIILDTTEAKTIKKFISVD